VARSQLASLPQKPYFLRSEQERLSSKTEQAERQIKVAEASFGDVEETLDKALDLLADCQRAYLPPQGHLRQCNQALFERLVVYEERIKEVDVAEPFATLADPQPPRAPGWRGWRWRRPFLLAAVRVRRF
jgi:hypothetical protein